MNDDQRSYLKLFLVVALLAACVTDCSMGTNRYCPGLVRQHVYKPPYTSLSCTTDKLGTHCHTVYHSAEYRLLVHCLNPAHVADINVGAYGYARYPDGQTVLVGERVGHWSRIIWNDWIEKETTNSY